MNLPNTSKPWPSATLQQRRQILRRVRLGDAAANVVATLAYPMTVLTGATARDLIGSPEVR